MTRQGTPASQDYTLWLWPLPQPGDGPLQFVAEWPAEGINRTSAEVDVEAITAAAGGTVELWSSS